MGSGFSRGGHRKDVADWLLDGKPRSFGHYHLCEDTVYSYTMCIAKAFRDHKVLVCSGDAVGYSRTTSVHLSQTTSGAYWAKFTCIQLSGSLDDKITLFDSLKEFSGPQTVAVSDIPDLLAMWRLTPTAEQRDTMRIYLKLSRDERKSMLALCELAKEVP